MNNNNSDNNKQHTKNGSQIWNFFTLVLKNLPLGITYALWSGLGLILIVIIGAVQFKEIPDLAAILGMLFIIIGIAIIHVFSKTIH